MSCDFNRDELRAALLRSTVLLEIIPSEDFAIQVEENKRVLKEEAANRP